MRRSSKVGILLGVFSLLVATTLGMTEGSAAGVERTQTPAIQLPYATAPKSVYMGAFVDSWEQKRDMFQSVVSDKEFQLTIEFSHRSP